MKANKIIVLLVFSFLLVHSAGAIAPANWTTGVKVGDQITLLFIYQFSPFDYEIMSGGSLVQSSIEQDDKIENLITEITSDTIWFKRILFDGAGILKVESDPIPIPKNNTEIWLNLFYPNPSNNSNGRFLTPVITTNVDELSSAYTGHDEYELILTTDKIIFEYLLNETEDLADHRLEYDRDTGLLKYEEWRYSTGVLLAQSIREDVVDQYVHSKCAACNTQVSTSDPDPSTTDETPLFLPIYGLFLAVFAFVTRSRKNKLKSKK